MSDQLLAFGAGVGVGFIVGIATIVYLLISSHRAAVAMVIKSPKGK